MRLLRIATLTSLSLTITASAQQTSLSHIQGNNPTSATEYLRILLSGQLLSHTLSLRLASDASSASPTLIAQCTHDTASGKLAFDLFVHFGDVTDLGFHAPIPPSPTHPRPRHIDLTETFSGYMELKPFRRQ